MARLKAERAASSTPVDTSGLDARIAELETDIRGAVAKLLRLKDADTERDAQSVIDGWRGELKALERERERHLAEVRADTAAPDVEAEADRLLATSTPWRRRSGADRWPSGTAS